MEFYLELDGRKQGPFDTIAMIRKIRGGRLKRMDVVWLGWDGDRVSAVDIADFQLIFDEYDEEVFSQEMKPVAQRVYGVKDLIMGGVEFVMQNPIVLVFTGIFFVLGLGGAALFSSIPMAGLLFSSVWFYGVFSVFQVSMLRKNRMQLVTPEFLSVVLIRFGVQLGIASAIMGLIIFGLPGFLAHVTAQPLVMLLMLLPGSVVWMFFFFAPLLIMDRGMKAIPALGYSFNMVRRMGSQNMITIYTTLILNYIVAPSGILLVISLPVTLIAMCELYDSFFNQYEA
jgi:hypothetical protein